jgi:hypothetical protein
MISASIMVDVADEADLEASPGQRYSIAIENL